jgi:hypothetical protein
MVLPIRQNVELFYGKGGKKFAEFRIFYSFFYMNIKEDVGENWQICVLSARIFIRRRRKKYFTLNSKMGSII